MLEPVGPGEVRWEESAGRGVVKGEGLTSNDTPADPDGVEDSRAGRFEG